MKTISHKQMFALWICVIYIGLSFFFIGTRAIWGLFRFASEYTEEVITRDVMLTFVEYASMEFWKHAYLVGCGFVLLTIVTIWISKTNKHDEVSKESKLNKKI